MQKSLFQKRFASVNISEDTDEEEDSLAPLPAVSPARRPSNDHEPTRHKWSEFFQQETVLERAASRFQVYFTSPENEDVPLFFFHHGAGSSAMSFAPLAKELERLFEAQKEEGARCGVISFDARGHGATRVTEDPDDYSANAFVRDAVFVIQEMLDRLGHKNPIFLIGHSLGGAILTEVSYELTRVGTAINGLVLLDIVEETATKSLQTMHLYLSNLPKSFQTLQRAIDWSVNVGSPRSRSSADITIPSLLKSRLDGSLTWIMDLKKTSPYWQSWFEGLSKRFVGLGTAKLLILAGSDSLDKELMIGQMQGKYQLVVFQDSGHFVQEDVPRKTALTLLDFWQRNNTSTVTIKSTWGSKVPK